MGPNSGNCVFYREYFALLDMIHPSISMDTHTGKRQKLTSSQLKDLRHLPAHSFVNPHVASPSSARSGQG